MKKTLWIWELFGFAVTSLAGTLLHYLYGWCGEATWSALFSDVNESTWEHMKLLFWPTFLYAIVQRFFFGERRDFWCVKLRGVLIGLGAIPVIFYTYNGAIGKSPDWLNIAIFFVAAALSFLYEAAAFGKKDSECRFPKLAFAALCGIALLFILFTFAAPRLGIFRDPLTGAYGI